MKKILILLISVLFLSGCSVDYNLKITNNTMSEEINILGVDITNYEILNSTSQLALYSDTRKVTDTTSIEEYNSFPQYNKLDITKNNIYGIKYSYDFDIGDYSDSNAVKNCYEFFRIISNGDKITLSTSNSFNCFALSDGLSKVTINITSYNEVVRSNADRVNGKTYTWEITRENASNKPILFEYDQGKKNITLIDYFINNIYVVVLLGVLLFVVGPVLAIIIQKNKKVNKI